MSNKFRLFTGLCSKGLVTLALAASAHGGDITFHLEAPQEGQAYQGVANIRGWAVSSAGIDRIELYIDDVYQTDIPFGGRRNDVNRAFPEHPGSLQSGFSRAYNYSKLSHGEHRFLVRIVDKEGDTQEKEVTLSTIGFSSAYIASADALDLSRATIEAHGQVIDIDNLILDGRAYDVQLTWRAESQLYQFTRITPR